MKSLKSTTYFCLLFFTCNCFWQIFPTLAQAQTQSRIAIVDLYGPDITAEARLGILKKFDESLRSETRLPVSLNEAALDRLRETAITEVESQKLLLEARTQLEKGRQAYVNLQLADARVALEAANKNFIKTLHLLNTNEELLRCHLYLGMTLLAQGEGKLAKKEFRKAALIDPMVELSTSEFRPEVLKGMEIVKQEIADGPKAGFTIDSEPAKADIFLNGKSIGRTSMNLSVPWGNYFIRLSKAGHRDWYQLVTVDKPYVQVRGALPAREESEKTAQLVIPVTQEEPADANFIDELAKKAAALQADILLLAEANTEGPEPRLLGQWYDNRTKEFSRLESVSVSGNPKALVAKVPVLIKSLLGHIDPNGYVLPDTSLRVKNLDRAAGKKSGPPPPLVVGDTGFEGLKPPSTAIKKGKPWYQKWWVWAVVGGLATATTAGIIIAGSGGSDKIFVDNGGNSP